MHEHDVVVVGAGPVGLSTAALLTQQGLDVRLLERYPGLYSLPRAANFDGETLRTFARIGVADRLAPLLRFEPKYEWRNAAGELLLEITYRKMGESGWPDFNQMYQPDVEAALFDACEANGVRVDFDTTVTGYHESGDVVHLDTSRGPVTARYVVACDGGNGTSRAAIGAELRDLGFSEPWLVCDFELDDPDYGLPAALQIGDPLQPTSIIALGHRHQRFSYMLDSAHDFQHESDPTLIWGRVAGYLRPDRARLVRVATYTFSSLISSVWRRGRVLLAGDVAHQMPPFLGQGMVSGIRDAQNLAFKLPLVLRGLAPDTLLDTYQTEREPHVESITARAIELGRIQTERDPVAAVERDRRLLAARASGQASPPWRYPGLGEGLLSSVDSPDRGRILTQGRVSNGGEPQLLDRFVDHRRFSLLCKDAAPDFPDDDLVTVTAIGAGGLLDVDGTYRAWFDSHAATAVLVRPDGYIFGSVNASSDASGLVDELRQALSVTP